MNFRLLFNIILNSYLILSLQKFRIRFEFQDYFRAYSKGLKLNWLHADSLCVVE